jgi:hypothetical protein
MRNASGAAAGGEGDPILREAGRESREGVCDQRDARPLVDSAPPSGPLVQRPINLHLEHPPVFCHRFRGNEVRLRLSIIVDDLGGSLRRAWDFREIKEWSLKSDTRAVASIRDGSPCCRFRQANDSSRCRKT